MKWITNENITEDTLLDMEANIDKDLLIARLCSELNISKKELLSKIDEKELMLLISTILINRDISDAERINKVFNNISESIISPYLLHNAELAADKILEYCLDRRAHIYIYADFDCDGITSGYVMFSALREICKGHITLKYPNRNEGYGLSFDFCDWLIDVHYDKEYNRLNDKVLVITVDNGISKIKEVQRLREHNIEVVITDHHTSEEEFVPKDCIIVDPHNNTIEQDDTFNHLCGCGVAFKVAQIAQEKCGKYNMMNYTPYLAIATLADVMPLADENLAFVQYGLDIINSSSCPKGIDTLKKIKELDVVTPNDILWVIAPMLNACGRMGDTELASKLFFLDDIMSCEEIINLINNTNEDRKKLTKSASNKISKLDFSNNNVCIYPTNEYPSGILGIIAGRVVEAFNKPSIVVTESKNGLYHGSVRSVYGIDMLTLLKELKALNLIEHCGGHPGACACTFNIENLSSIQEFFDSLVMEELHNEEVIEEPSILVDEVISLGHLSEIVYALVNIFPCDNRMFQTPTFGLTNVKLETHKRFKSGYTEIVLKQDGVKFETSIYGEMVDKFFDEILPNLNEEKEIHLIGTIDKQSFFSSKFQKKVYTLKVVDIMNA